MEALTAMRQGYEPNEAQKGPDGQRRHGLSDRRQRQAGGSIRGGTRPGAHADLICGSEVQLFNWSPTPPVSSRPKSAAGSQPGYTSNEDKAKYLTALLIGPVYQAFDGSPTARDSGLLHASTGPSAPFIQNVFELVKPIVRATVDLLSAGQRQAKDRQKDLLARVAALKSFLDKNPPADRHLVPDGGGISDRALAR